MKTYQRIFAWFGGLCAIFLLSGASLMRVPHQPETAVASTKALQTYIDKACETRRRSSRRCVDAANLLGAVDPASLHYRLDRNMLLAVIRNESSFDQAAKNGSSIGLTQTLLRYHRGKYAHRHFHRPVENVRVGASILKQCMVKHRAVVAKALGCYNGGGDPKYVTKVLAHLSNIRKLELPPVAGSRDQALALYLASYPPNVPVRREWAKSL